MDDGHVEQTIVDLSIVQKLSSEGERRQAVLLVQQGNDLKGRHHLRDGRAVVGRDLGCDIAINDTKASRQHAEFECRGHDRDGSPIVHLRDLGSTNGVFVNGRKVDEVRLEDRDKVIVGNTILRFFLREESVLRAEERLLRMASVDALTGLRNRASFDGELDRSFALHRQSHKPLSFLIFDIDHFKRFNDTHGHQTGDEVLRKMGAIVSDFVRLEDFAARYGGEEFVLILNGTSLEAAGQVGERLRREVERTVFQCGEKALAVTISIGAATLRDDMVAPTELVEAADKALYRAKAEGRNRVVVA